MNPNNDQQIPEVDPKTGEIIINLLKEDGTEKDPRNREESQQSLKQT